MSNEEIVEEIYNTVYQNNLMTIFSDEVSNIMRNENRTNLYEIVNEVYFKYVKNGLIKE